MSIHLARQITEQAISIADEPYRLAVALEVEGKDASKFWHQLARIMSRAQVLLGLNGLADAARQAKLSGADLFVEDEPVAFDRDEEFMSADPGPFRAAVRLFEGRIPRLTHQVRDLVRRAEELADAIMAAERGAAIEMLSQAGVVQQALSGVFFVSDVDGSTTIDLKGLLAEAIRGDITIREAGRLAGVDLSTFVNRAQVEKAVNLTKARLQTIYRTNLASAYNQGQSQQLADHEVQRFIPLMILSEVRDRRTRGNPGGLYPQGGFHWQMHGFVGTVDDFNRLGILPPNGYSCRAGVRGVSRSEAKRRGWLTDAGALDRVAIEAYNGDRLAIVARGDYPDPGFVRI